MDLKLHNSTLTILSPTIDAASIKIFISDARHHFTNYALRDSIISENSFSVSLRNGSIPEWAPLMDCQFAFQVENSHNKICIRSNNPKARVTACADTLAFLPVLISSLQVDKPGPDPNYQIQNLARKAGPQKRTLHHKISSLIFRVLNGSLTLDLHAGYDFTSTRSSISAAAERYRDKLYRLRNLVQSDRASESAGRDPVLFNSIHIGQDICEKNLTSGTDSIDEIREELATQISSQPSDDAWIGVKVFDQNQTQRLKNQALERSASASMEIKVDGVAGSFRFSRIDHDLQYVSSEIQANTFEILDNIRTSAWHTFLSHWNIRARAQKHPPFVAVSHSRLHIPSTHLTSEHVHEEALHVSQGSNNWQLI